MLSLSLGLHELDPVFRKVTLENERLKSLVRDLQFHKDPVGSSYLIHFHEFPFLNTAGFVALQSMVDRKSVV